MNPVITTAEQFWYMLDDTHEDLCDEWDYWDETLSNDSERRVFTYLECTECEDSNTFAYTPPTNWVGTDESNFSVMMAGDVNKNGRVYDIHEMSREVNRYNKEFIDPRRAMGELNHPTAAEVDLERACHIVTELHMDRNVAMGKSMVLSTPCGKILESLIKDGVKVGVSSRALGQLVPMEGKEDTNVVKNMKLIAIDAVADPSYPKAFVNGILESKQYVLADDGQFEEIYEDFESKIGKLPRQEVEEYLKEQVLDFINKINSKL